jgi:hypothetical protein
MLGVWLACVAVALVSSQLMTGRESIVCDEPVHFRLRPVEAGSKCLTKTESSIRTSPCNHANSNQAWRIVEGNNSEFSIFIGDECLGGRAQLLECTSVGNFEFQVTFLSSLSHNNCPYGTPLTFLTFHHLRLGVSTRG